MRRARERGCCSHYEYESSRNEKPERSTWRKQRSACVLSRGCAAASR